MRRLRELLLWVGAALGLVAIAAGIAVALGGFSFLIFRSGSMSPEIPTGGIALSRTVEASELEPGDVVSVTAANGERITHRVVSTTLRGDEASLVLKGDANATEDSEIYVVTSAERVVASLPIGGYVIAHALTPPGLVALASLSLMLILLTGGKHEDEDDAPRAPRTRPRHRGRVAGRQVVVGAVLLTAVGAGAGAAHTTGTWARFTDQAAATSGGFAAAVVAPAASITCDTNTGTIRWTAPVSGTPTGYRMSWTYSGGSGTTNFAAGVLTGRPPAPAYLSSRTYTVTISALNGTWASVPTGLDTIRAQGNLFGHSWSC